MNQKIRRVKSHQFHKKGGKFHLGKDTFLSKYRYFLQELVLEGGNINLPHMVRRAVFSERFVLRFAVVLKGEC